MISLLYKRYGQVSMAARRYACADHVPTSTGGASQIADFVAYDVWNSGLTWHGHEVKCSRADWLTELKNPWKSEATKKYMNYWWLVVSDASIVKDGELPDDWGFMVVVKNGLRAVKTAPRLSPEPMTPRYFAAFARALQKSASSERVAEMMVDSYGATMKELLRQNTALRGRLLDAEKMLRQNNLQRLAEEQ